MAPELSPHRAQTHREAKTPLSIPRDNVSSLFSVAKTHELPDFRAGLQLQHGDTIQEVIVDNDVADYIVTLGLPKEHMLYHAYSASEQDGRLTRQQIADEMDTSTDHIRIVEIKAEMALADAIVQPVKHDDENFYDPLFRLELNFPESQTLDNTIATVTRISDAFPVTGEPASAQIERPVVLKRLLDEMRPFLALQERVVDIVERHATEVAEIKDPDVLLATAVKENLTIPITKPGDPLTVTKLATPLQYFDQQVERYVANAMHEDDARKKASVDLQGKVASGRTGRELHRTLKEYPVSTEQIAGAEEIADRVFTSHTAELVSKLA